MDVTSLIGLAPVVTAIGGLAGSIRFVQESQRGVKLRWGRVVRHRDGRPKIVEPGFVFLVPTMHRLRRIHVRTSTLTLDPQRIMLKDHTVFNVGALIITRIIDDEEGIYRSLFEVDDLPTSVEEFCAAALRDVLVGITYDKLADPAALAECVRTSVEPQLREWGTEVKSFALTDCSPSPETARMILISAEAQFRADALAAVCPTLEQLSGIPPMLAAALIGTPVSVALGGTDDSMANGGPKQHPYTGHFSIGRHGISAGVSGPGSSREDDDT